MGRKDWLSREPRTPLPVCAERGVGVRVTLTPASAAADKAPDVGFGLGFDDDVATGVEPVAFGVAPGAAFRPHLVVSRWEIGEADVALGIGFRRGQRRRAAGCGIDAELHVDGRGRALPEPVETRLRYPDGARPGIDDDRAGPVRLVRHLDQ